jgi:hypothetical protein
MTANNNGNNTFHRSIITLYSGIDKEETDTNGDFNNVSSTDGSCKKHQNKICIQTLQYKSKSYLYGALLYPIAIRQNKRKAA